MSREQHDRYQFWGWVLFVVSALLFIASSIRAEDPVGLAGGVLFLVACFVFLVPLVTRSPGRDAPAARGPS